MSVFNAIVILPSDYLKRATRLERKMVRSTGVGAVAVFLLPVLCQGERLDTVVHKMTEMCGIAGLLMDVLVVDMCCYNVTLLENTLIRR